MQSLNGQRPSEEDPAGAPTVIPSIAIRVIIFILYCLGLGTIATNEVMLTLQMESHL